MQQTFKFREAIPEDMPVLAALHVKTWNDTYLMFTNKPTYETRKYQWEKAFAEKPGNWFCYVIENEDDNIIGFATGNDYVYNELPYKGQLNKIYLLKEYQRLGLGRKLVGYVVRYFFKNGIDSMLLFSEPENPSIKFYDALNGERLLSKEVEFHGGYGWKDLNALAEICPID